MYPIKRFIFCSLALSLLLGCGFSTEKRRPAAIEKQMKERSVKVISEADILEEVRKKGDSITQEAQAALLDKLSTKIAEGSYKAAVSYCAKNAQELTDSLANKYQVHLKRVSLKNRNALNKPSKLEQGLLEAYQYTFEQGGSLNNNVQFYSNEDSILYNKPIFIGSELCLNCHGDKSNQALEVKEILKDNYPADSAHGYKIGDLRGMWSVAFSKKQLVKSM